MTIMCAVMTHRMMGCIENAPFPLSRHPDELCPSRLHSRAAMRDWATPHHTSLRGEVRLHDFRGSQAERRPEKRKRADETRDVNEPGKCGLGSGRVFEMQARAKCGPGGLNLKIFFFAILRGVVSEKVHNCPNFLLKKVCTKKLPRNPF